MKNILLLLVMSMLAFRGVYAQTEQVKDTLELARVLSAGDRERMGMAHPYAWCLVWR